VAGPAPPGLSLELALEGPTRASAGDFQSLREPFGRYIVDLPVLSGSMRTESSDVLEAARIDLAAGRIDVALDHLLRASVYAVVQGVKLLTIPRARCWGALQTRSRDSHLTSPLHWRSAHSASRSGH
jgi:hypothetical protein